MRRIRRGFTVLVMVALVVVGVASSAGSHTANASTGKGRGLLAFACVQGAKNNYWEICTAPASGGKESLLSNSASPAIGPTFSPDGLSIAYLCHWERSSGNFTIPVSDLVDFGPAGFSCNSSGDLCVSFPDGSEQRRLTTGGTLQPPVWSPDSTTLAFAQGGGPIVVGPPGAAPRPAGIWIIIFNGDGLRQLTTNDDDFPAWSPDGATIAVRPARTTS